MFRDKNSKQKFHCRLTIWKTPGSSAEHYSLAGEETPYPAFEGTTLKDIRLTAGNVQIFRINP